jgi:hypothetical protein
VTKPGNSGSGNYWVGPTGDGQWQVRQVDGERASDVLPTQREAWERGRELSQTHGGGELTVQGRDGRIVSKDTIPPGRDPFPPRDTER